MENNYRYTQHLCRFCLGNNARFINASSAATYGGGEHGFSDNEDGLDALRPLNMYGYSKQLFDLWAKRAGVLDRIVSLKFFNVFGPNEYHKGDMMSVICKAFSQINETGKLKLFRSHRDDYEDGGQTRDFVYVKDCVDIMAWFLQNPDVGGIFNVGTGNARSFRDLAIATFDAMGKTPEIEFIDMPVSIRDKYQYFTEAEMGKLRKAGYAEKMTPLEDAAKDYVQHYLAQNDPHLKP
jgi:ADP-L-glycero-D-manno-heptose 6-epimerase